MTTTLAAGSAVKAVAASPGDVGIELEADHAGDFAREEETRFIDGKVVLVSNFIPPQGVEARADAESDVAVDCAGRCDCQYGQGA